jgi:hypothetical protein
MNDTPNTGAQGVRSNVEEPGTGTAFTRRALLSSLTLGTGTALFDVSFASFASAEGLSTSADVRWQHESLGGLPPAKVGELGEFKKQTRALYDAKEAAVASGKLDPLLTRFYLTDVISFGPDAKIIHGIKELKQGFNEGAKQVASMSITSIHPYVSGDVGWDWANIENRLKDGSKLYVAILFLWVKINGLWVSAGETYAASPGKPIAW